VKIKDQGNIVIFNPFVVDPFRHVSLYVNILSINFSMFQSAFPKKPHT